MYLSFLCLPWVLDLTTYPFSLSIRYCFATVFSLANELCWCFSWHLFQTPKIVSLSFLPPHIPAVSSSDLIGIWTCGSVQQQTQYWYMNITVCVINYVFCDIRSEYEWLCRLLLLDKTFKITIGKICVSMSCWRVIICKLILSFAGTTVKTFWWFLLNTGYLDTNLKLNQFNKLSKFSRCECSSSGYKVYLFKSDRELVFIIAKLHWLKPLANHILKAMSELWLAVAHNWQIQ